MQAGTLAGLAEVEAIVFAVGVVAAGTVSAITML